MKNEENIEVQDKFKRLKVLYDIAKEYGLDDESYTTLIRYPLVSQLLYLRRSPFVDYFSKYLLKNKLDLIKKNIINFYSTRKSSVAKNAINNLDKNTEEIIKMFLKDIIMFQEDPIKYLEQFLDS